ncbi:MAG: Asp/Glu/hydantoin racemase [Rhodobacteraceae bacterium]|nr:Asp/Glu/hydantoin racemase [Paracoccaceae bacterium]
MKITVINPNSTVSMTDKIAEAARAAAPPDVTIEGRTCAGSPASIQGAADGELAAPHLLAELQRAVADGAQAVIIACFDDTALAEARKITDVPVVGIGEAGYHAAILMGTRFSVVTTLSVSVPVLEQNLVDYGLASHCLKVRASEVPVLDLEKPGSDAREKISGEIARAIEEDAAEAIVLGCAGMADLAADLTRTHGIPVIDGVAAATGLARTLIGLTA